MTLVKDAAEQLIGQFGVTVKVYSQSGPSPKDSNDPVFFEENENTTDFDEYKVRLYTSNSDEMLEDYGFNPDAESMMYSTEDIASEGDKVEYEAGGYKWNVRESSTNQLGAEGPYIFVYSLGEI